MTTDGPTSFQLTRAILTAATAMVVTAAVAVSVTAVHAKKKQKSHTEPQSRSTDDTDNASGKKEAAAARSRAKYQAETWDSHVGKHGALRELWPGTLWVLEAEGCHRGPPVRNMGLYRVPDDDETGRLVIYNGVAVDESTISQIEELGTPTVLVVPNCYHRCCAAVWKKRYPNLKVVCPAVAFEEASKVIEIDGTTEEWTGMVQWSKWINAKTIDGWGDFENVLEVQLEPSGGGKKAILVCDLLFTVPYPEDMGYMDRFMFWLFDSSIDFPPEEGTIIVPKVARLSRIFAIQDWTKAEGWYRQYAREHGRNVAAIVVGHGPPVQEIDPAKGCTEAFEGVAEQLTKPRW